MTEPVTRLTLETPAGLIGIEAEVRDGKARKVTFRNVPAFAAHLVSAGASPSPLDVAGDPKKMLSEVGASLAYYLKARKMYPASDFAGEGVDRLVKKIVPDS